MQNDPPRQVDLGPQYPSRSHKYKTGCGSIYVVIARDPDDHQIRMVFANLGKAGGCSQAQTEAVCRMLTRSLRAGDDPDAIVLSLRGIRCHQTAHMGTEEITSCADAIGRALAEDISIELESDVNGYDADSSSPA